MRTQEPAVNKKAKTMISSWQGREISSLTLVYWSMAAALACFLANFVNLSI